MAIKARQTITIAIERDVVSSVPYYKRAASQPSKPSDNTTASGMVSAGWSTTEPEYSSSNSNPVWVTFFTTFSNGTTSCSDVSKYLAFNAATEAHNAAIAAHTVIVDSSPPSDTSKLWYDTNSNTVKQYDSRTDSPTKNTWIEINDVSTLINEAKEAAVDEAHTDAVTTAQALINQHDNELSPVSGQSLKTVLSNISASNTWLDQKRDMIQFTIGSYFSDQWLMGTEITGLNTSPTGFAGFSQQAQVGMYYFNTETKNVYKCTTAGTGSTAKWVYDGKLQESLYNLMKNTATYFNFEQDGLHIGKNGDPYKLLLSNSKISMMYLSGDTPTELSYWDTESFVSDIIKVKEMFSIHNYAHTYQFVMIPKPDGTIAIRRQAIS